MKKLNAVLIGAAVSFFSLKTNCQVRKTLKNDRGVSLSYSMQFYKNCKDGVDKEYKIYRITAYLSNESGRSIKMAESWVSANNSRYLNCISEYDNFGQIKFNPSGILNASPEWDTQGKPWPNNSTLSGTYYIAIPVEEKEPPAPDWAMGGFVFTDDKKTTSPQWSSWISGDCFKKISYRYMGKELVNLNYQYHYYFQAKNDYAETIYFIMSLKDADGKERFGTRYSIRPGQTIEFVEKMDKNYIWFFAIEKVCFKIDNGKYVACDDENSQNKSDTKSSIEEDARKVAEIFCTGFRLNKADTKKEFENFIKETEPYMNAIDKKYYKGRMESEFMMGNKEFEYFEKLVAKEIEKFCK